MSQQYPYQQGRQAEESTRYYNPQQEEYEYPERRATGGRASQQPQRDAAGGRQAPGQQWGNGAPSDWQNQSRQRTDGSANVRGNPNEYRTGPADSSDRREEEEEPGKLPATKALLLPPAPWEEGGAFAFPPTAPPSR